MNNILESCFGQLRSRATNMVAALTTLCVSLAGGVTYGQNSDSIVASSATMHLTVTAGDSARQSSLITITASGDSLKEGVQKSAAKSGSSVASATREKVERLKAKLEATSGRIIPNLGSGAIDVETQNIDVDSVMNTTILPPVIDLTEEDDPDVWDDDIKVKSKGREWFINVMEEHWEAFVALGLMAFFVGILPMLIVIIVIGMILRARRRYQRDRLNMIDNLIRSGYPLPRNFSLETGRFRSRRAAFSSAVRWLAVGIAVMIFFGVAGGVKPMIILGIVPLTVGGVKMIIYYRFDRNEDDERIDAEPDQNQGMQVPPMFKGTAPRTKSDTEEQNV